MSPLRERRVVADHSVRSMSGGTTGVSVCSVKARPAIERGARRADANRHAPGRAFPRGASRPDEGVADEERWRDAERSHAIELVFAYGLCVDHDDIRS
jgi:hypothetical protein